MLKFVKVTIKRCRLKGGNIVYFVLPSNILRHSYK
ncbi:hypothetical protein UFOVP39_44 [uncultured Caudovirales phage]|jgi:hypothetical protein|uniref:Uncharacterized protein n=1 Tax=uncultured Caudovirales phage TaxID=2100421 RepID=A0A6J5T767_9CAUD|nr:hypothetical protein UFOVP39_44 [uncultured Caudovirales phage]